MKKILVILSASLIVACAKESKTHEKEEAGAAAVTVVQEGSEVQADIDNKHLYSEEFLHSFREMQSNMPLTLKDNYILVENDTVYFPEDLKQMKDYHFTGFTEKYFYQLDVRRTNLTSIEYEYVVLENEKQLYTSEGTAHLSAGFILGSETDDDDETGEGYLLTEYSATGKDAHSIKIGEPDEKGRLRAVVSGGKPNEAVNPGVTLRESM